MMSVDHDSNQLGGLTTGSEDNDGTDKTNKFLGENHYAASGQKGRAHGFMYQLKLLMLFLVRGLRYGYNFRLASEMNAAEKFDDIVLQYRLNDDNVTKYRFLQAKHCLDESKKISADDLLNNKDFKLQKYFLSYCNMERDRVLSQGEWINFVICTNMGFDHEQSGNLPIIELKENSGKPYSAKIRLKEDKTSDDMLDIDTPTKQNKRYKLCEDKNSELYQLLKSPAYLLAETLLEHISDNRKRIELQNEHFKRYHTALAEEVVNTTEHRIFENFITGENLSERAHVLREIMHEMILKKNKFTKISNPQDGWALIRNSSLKLSTDFRKRVKVNTNPKLTDLEELSKIFFKLLENANDEKVIEARRIHNVNLLVESNMRILAENIEKLSEHVLIRTKNNFIKFRWLFLVEDFEKPGNIGAFRVLLKDKLESRYQDLNRYQFEIEIFPVSGKIQLHWESQLPDNVDSEKISTFYDKLIFAVHQPTETQLDDIIKSELRQEKFNERWKLKHSNVDLLYDSFKEGMLDWFKHRGHIKGQEGTFMSTEDGWNLLDLIARKVYFERISGLSLMYREKIERYGMKFGEQNPQLIEFLTIEDAQNTTTALHLRTAEETLPTAIRVHHAIKESNKFPEKESITFIPLKLLLSEPFVQDWLTGAIKSQKHGHLLVVECEVLTEEAVPKLKELYQELYETNLKNPVRKVIFIADRTLDLKNCQTIDDNVSFHNFTENSLDELLQKEVIILQGRQKKMSLGKLLETSVTDYAASKKSSEFPFESMESSTFVRLIRGEEIKIGYCLNSSNEIETYYIDRKFDTQVTINTDVLKSPQKSDLFAISHGNKELLRELGVVGENELLVKSELCRQQPRNIVLLNRGGEEDHFNRLCREDSNRDIHWLFVGLRGLVWRKSRGSITTLVNYRCSNEYFCSHDNCEACQTATTAGLSVNQLIANMGDERRVFIISDTAGMGKTTVLNHLAKKMRHTIPEMWIISIDLNNFTEALRTENNKRTFNENEVDRAFDFFMEKLSSLDTDLEKAILRKKMTKGRRVTLLFDGFDEISPDYKEIVTDMLIVFQKYGMMRLVVATRSNMQSELERRLQIFSYSMKPFSNENQVDFLVKFWRKASDQSDEELLKSRAELVINKLAKSISDPFNSFTGIPLQIRMVAEIFPSDDTTKLSAEIVIADLFQWFVEKKYDIYQTEKKKTDPTKLAEADDTKILHARFLKTHRLLAIKTIFNEKDFSKLSLHRREIKIINDTIMKIKDGRERTGIVIQVVDGQPQFLHRTFIEYFTAIHLMDVLEEDFTDRELGVFVINRILIQQEYRNIRCFLNDLLKKKSLSSTVIKFKHVNQNELRNEDGRTVFHTAAAEGYVEIAKFFLDLLGRDDKVLRQNLLDIRDNLDNTALHSMFSNSAEQIPRRSTDDLHMVQWFLENGADMNAINSDKISPLFSAARAGRWEAFELLVKDQRADVGVCDSEGITLQHEIVEYGDLNLLKWLIGERRVDVDVRDIIGNTLQHYAVFYGQIDVLKWLIEERRVDLDVRDNAGKTLQHYAVFYGQIDVLKWLIDERGLDIDVRDNDGATLQHYAVFHGQIDVLKWLIEERRVDLDVRGNAGKTLQHYAVFYGQIDVLKWLIEERGLDINVRDNNGATLQHCAVEKGQIDVLKWLIEERRVDLDVRDNAGTTLQHYAVFYGQIDVLKWLIEERRVDLDVRDNNGATLQHYAVFYGQIDVLKWLIDERGLDIDVWDNNGATLQHYAVLHGQIDVLKWLIEERRVDLDVRDNNGATLQHYAVFYGQIDVLKWLIDERRVDLDVRDNAGKTLQHYAVFYGQIDVLKWLIDERGLDIDVRDNDGATLQHYAVFHGQIDVLKWLIEERRVDLDVRDNAGKTLQHYAVEKGQIDVLKWLIEERGLDIDVRDNAGATLQHYAVFHGQIDVLKWLIEERRVDLDVRDNAGTTLQHCAVEKGQIDVLKWLIEERRVDLDVRDNAGKTLQHYAVFDGQIDVLKWLIDERGLDIDVRDNDGATLQHYAVFHGQIDVLKWLIEERRVDLDVRDNNGVTVQHYAVYHGQINVLKWLTEERRVDLDVRDNAGKTLQHYAVFYGQIDVLKWLIEERRVDLDVRDNAGTTLQHCAVEKGQIDVLKWLIEERRVDLDVRDNAGKTLQHYAVFYGQIDVLKWLIEERRVDLDVRDNAGTTLQHCAVEKGQIDVLKWLIEERRVDLDVRDNNGATLQHYAVFYGQIDVLKWLIDERGLDIDVWDNNGATLQHYAVLYGQIDVLKWLIEERRVDLDVRDNAGKTLQHYAVFYGQIDVLKWLIDERGLDIDVRDNDGATLQHYAVFHGQIDVLKWLIEERRVDLDVRDNAGKTLQHYAVEKGQIDVLKWLIEERGLDIDVRDNAGATLQHYAVFHGQIDVLKWLIEERRVDIDVRDNAGATLQHYAVFHGQIDVLKWLIEERRVDLDVRDNAGKTLQHYAVEKGQIDVLKWLIEERGLDIDVRDNNGATLQHYAVLYGQIDVLKWLIEERRVDLDVRNKNGATLQHYAVLYGQIDVLKWLIEERRVDLDVRNNNGATLQHYAVLYGQIDVLKWLIEERGLDIDVRDNAGATLQHYAVFHGQIDVLKWLIEERRVDLDVRDNAGTTLQHCAVFHGQIDVLKWLIEERRVDLDVRNNNGATLQHCAVEKGQIDVLKWLIEERRVDLDVRDNNGVTVQHYAVFHGQINVLKWLIEERRVDLDVRNNNGATLQHCAVEKGQIDVLKWLIEERRVDLDVRDNNGVTVQHYAVFHGQINVLKWLIEERRVDLDVRDNAGATLQHYAVFDGQIDVLKWLIEERGLDIDVRDNNGEETRD